VFSIEIYSRRSVTRANCLETSAKAVAAEAAEKRLMIAWTEQQTDINSACIKPEIVLKHHSIKHCT